MRPLATLLLLLFCAGCVHVNEVMNAEHALLADASASDRSFGGIFPFTHRDWEVGQWVKTAQRDGEVWSLQTISIVGDSSAGFWLEFVTISPTTDENPSIMKMEIKGYERGNPASVRNISIGTVITQNGSNKPMMAPPFMGPMTSGWVLKNFEIDSSSGTKEAVTVPAGSFSDATKIRFKANWGPIKAESDNWLHNEVPIWGIVKSLSTDGKYETRLIDFGHTGATSKIDDSQVLGGVRGPFGMR